MKDVKGHGSNTKGADEAAAEMLAAEHPKSGPVPTHGGAPGRTDMQKVASVYGRDVYRDSSGRMFIQSGKR